MLKIITGLYFLITLIIYFSCVYSLKKAYSGKIKNETEELKSKKKELENKLDYLRPIFKNDNTTMHVLCMLGGVLWPFLIIQNILKKMKIIKDK